VGRWQTQIQPHPDMIFAEQQFYAEMTFDSWHIRAKEGLAACPPT